MEGMNQVVNECPKCGCPHWRENSIRTADSHSAWKDVDGTWYNGPASESITKSCAHCGWTQRIEKRRGKTISIVGDTPNIEGNRQPDDDANRRDNNAD